jgi:hypothetical protein
LMDTWAVYNSQKLETAQVSINRKMDKLVHLPMEYYSAISRMYY